MTNSPNTKRRSALGGLLTGTTGETPATAPAPAADAPRPGRPAARATAPMDTRGTPALLPRVRSSRVPKDKLTVSIPVSLLDALTALVGRDDTRRYDEVEEALRAHFAKKNIPVDEES